MSHNVSRRVFLGASLLSGAMASSGSLRRLAAAEAAAASSVVTGLSTYELGPQIWVRWDNRVVTCYRAHRTQKLPYLYPLTGPLSGLSVTSESADPYPHHRSCFLGCDRVNGGNYWQEGLDRGQILSSGPKLGAVTQNSVEILDTCDWKKPDGPVVMRDERRILISIVNPRLRYIDWHVKWQAVEDVTILKTNHSLFSLRAAADLTPNGGGQLVNADGLNGEKTTFGKTSAWCDFSGKREGFGANLVEGVALFDHPKNPWAPTPWFTRDYGFVSASPTYFMEKSFELPAGKSLLLKYRVVIHTGDAKEAGLADLYKEWARLG